MQRFIRENAIFAVLAAAVLTGCAGTGSSRPKLADDWYSRAGSKFKSGDFEDAHDSAQKALAIVQEDPDVRTLAAEVALTTLDYAEVLRLLKDVKTTDAARLRGRALWYKGDLELAADELETMLNDPNVTDDWAKSTSKLARRGAGRTPFSHSGAMLASVEMVHVSPVAPYFIVPIEIDGEAALAMVATGSAEVVIDSSTRPEPSWVSLRFGDKPQKFEVTDVPALPQDLSGISKELGAPIKALLGINLLRHLNATFDFTGRQFVVRNFAPPPPPSATRVDLHYVRGGGLVLRSAVGGEKGPRELLMVDTSRPFPVALDAEGWKKAGIEPGSLKLIPGDPEQKLREGTVPLMRLGAFDVPKVQGIFGIPGITEMEKAMSVDLDGLLGAGFLYTFRCTLADGGRLLWVEDQTSSLRMLGMDPNPTAPPPSSPPTRPAAEPAPAAPKGLPPKK